MKPHLRLASLIFNQPQLVTDPMMSLAVQWANHALNLNIVNLTVNGVQPKIMEDGEFESGAQMAAASERRRALVSDTGMDIIPVSGILVSRSAHMNPCEPMTSYEGLRAAVNQAVADPAVEHIVLDIDSNGGSATGAFELADDIRAASLMKPITAIVNFSAFSGGYLIAAAASKVIVSRTSGVGSIGVIANHLDVSKRDELQGIKVTSAFAGDHKNDLTPHEPLSDQSLTFLTSMVQNSYKQFVDAIANFRGLSTQAVKDTQAGIFFGQKGVEAGLADSVETPQAAINRIAAEVRASRAGRQSSNTRRSVSARAAAMNMQAMT
ncbi:S49 family peptidase [Burkholderia pseudomallei]|uniref:S49 family peptidase n=1 Tax=Burkholderia pseudomallei TaxID=28450 RepID=UPI0005387B14|nr:S49 family peptidase [Burkholderia pseudomallei]AJX78719.1 peptidase S49 family protein [Burkholderia pseudomallei MSHR2543]KGW22190.1 peptidase S49 family protein [Burkholderia pseudomallei MSHR733]OMY97500.1 capsid protein [Burkholderia pseudomallei]OMY99740.1 capsid protein [Burkholderia pseudomallei]OMZ01602.1 capsid protein [Burkholderia pseudomallei]